MNFKYATPVIYGTALFARVEGKLKLIGNIVSKPDAIGPMQVWVDRGTVMNLPLLRKVN